MKIYNLFSLPPKTIVRYDLSLMLLSTGNSVNLSKNERLDLIPLSSLRFAGSSLARSLFADAAALLLRHTLHASRLVPPSQRSSGTGPCFLTPRRECKERSDTKTKPRCCQKNDGLKSFSPLRSRGAANILCLSSHVWARLLARVVCCQPPTITAGEPQACSTRVKVSV